MAALREEQWELDGWLFGDFTPVRVLEDGLDYGVAEVRVQDVDRPQADGTLMGRDYYTGPELQLTLALLDAVTVWPTEEAGAQQWRADGVRSEPGALSTLRYKRAGVTYRYLGRGRRWGVVPGKLKNDRFQEIAATFKLAAPEKYVEPAEGDEASRSLILRLVEAPSDGGWIFVDVWPIETRPNTQARQGEVTVGGTRPAPFRAVIHGPSAGGTLSGISLSGDGWEITTTTTLKHDEELVIDTATNTIAKGVTGSGSTVSVAGTLTRNSRLTARLRPGHQLVRFTGTDPSATAYAEITWFDTLPA